MKALITFILGTALVFSPCEGDAQVFASSQLAGIVGSSLECIITDGALTTDDDVNTFAQLRVDDSLSGSYVYQKLQFPGAQSAGEYVAIIVEAANGATLNQSTLANADLSLYLNDTASGSVLHSGDYNIAATPAWPGRYVLEFVAGAAFDCLRLDLHSGMAGTATALKSYAAYYSNTPLPITLLDFKASRQASTVMISWKTLTETNNRHFTVERSEDGLAYEPVAKVQGAGDSQMERSYEVADPMPLTTMLYYRISQTDLNGHVQFFPATLVEALESEHLLDVYPNPSNGASLTISMLESGKATVAIISSTGSCVYEAFVPAGNGITALQIPSLLQKGIYTVFVSSADGLRTRRVVVQ